MVTMESMNQLLDKLSQLELEKRRVSAQIDDIKNMIAAGLDGSTKMSTDRYDVSWCEYTQNKFDTTRFKKIHSALYMEFLKAVTAHKLTYKAR